MKSKLHLLDHLLLTVIAITTLAILCGVALMLFWAVKEGMMVFTAFLISPSLFLIALLLMGILFGSVAVLRNRLRRHSHQY